MPKGIKSIPKKIPLPRWPVRHDSVNTNRCKTHNGQMKIDGPGVIVEAVSEDVCRKK